MYLQLKLCLLCSKYGNRKRGMVQSMCVKKYISASMMCSKLVNLEETIKVFENEKIDYLHIDVMDGDFVPNLGLGIDYINGIRELTYIPLDIHLMISKPEEKIDWLQLRKQDIVSIHYESTLHINKTIIKAKEWGGKVFLAINPGTPIYCVEEVLDYIDGINLLMVNPGFAGQRIVPTCIKKTLKLVDFLLENGYKDKIIEVDGNISNENAKTLSGFGANMFVAGTSSIFSSNVCDMQRNIKNLRKAIGD